MHLTRNPGQHKSMKNLTPVLLTTLLLAAPLSTAQAQTRIGGVTLTPIGKAAPTTPAPSSSSSRVSQHSYLDVPAGMREVRGRISASSEGVRLPAGSTINVSITDVASGRAVIGINFKTTRLSTPYQMIFSPNRIATTRRYVVRAVISDAGGKLLYRSADVTLPTGPQATLNLSVR